MLNSCFLFFQVPCYMHNRFSFEDGLQYRAVADESSAGQFHSSLVGFYYAGARYGFFVFKGLPAFAGAYFYSADLIAVVLPHIYCTGKAVVMGRGIGHIGTEGGLQLPYTYYPYASA